MSGRARSPACFLAAVLIAIPFLITAGLGTDFDIQPASITPGSPFSIALYNVTDGASLNITATPSFLPPAPTSWCNFTNWRYSFALQKGNVTVNGANTNRIQLLVRTGKTYQMTEKTGTGDITVTSPLEYLPDIYYDFRILYEAHDPNLPVKLTLVQQGIKSGPEESVSTPNIFGMSEGSLSIRIREDGKLLGGGEIRIGPPSLVPTTVPATPVPTAVSNGTPATHVPTTPAVTTLTTLTTVTSPPVTTRAPGTSPATVPAATPSPEPSPGGASPVILIYAAVIIIIAILADYYLLKD